MPPTKHLESLQDGLDIGHFADAMKAKMDASRDKGRHGWRTCSTADLWTMLREHVEKGDPVDIANFCMMIYFNSKRIVQS